MKKLLAAVTLGTLVGCAGAPQLPPPPKEPIRDHLIVPKLRIGEAALGMTEAQLLEWLGTPSETHRLGRTRVWYQYKGKGLNVIFEEGRAVTVQALADSVYRTADGIGVGTPELKVRAAWGRPTKAFDMHELNSWDYCFPNDLKVTVDTRRSTVVAVGIYADGCSGPSSRAR